MIVRIKRNITLVAFAMLLSYFSMGQGALLKTAEHHFENLSYVKAIDAYEQALKKKGVAGPEKFKAQKNLAICYLKVKDSQSAERVLRDLVSTETDFSGERSEVLLNYAQALASNAKYKESQEQYQKYTEISDSDPRGKGFSKLYNDVNVLNKNAACYKVDYLSINTTAADFSPSYYQNGLVFVSNRRNTSGVRRVYNWNNTPFLDLYHLDDVAMLSATEAGLGGGGSSSKSKKRSNGVVGSDEYTSPTANDSKTLGSYGGKSISAGSGYADKPITESDRMSGSINSKYHEGPAAFFKDGSKVLFTRNNVAGGNAKKSSDGIVKLKLYMGEAKKDSWGNITELPFNSDEYSTGHPAISPDEKLVFFASDMPGGFGGTDIYVTRYEGGASWSAPINLGKEINTKGNEMFPTVDDKGNLYFSSDGLPGLGELDLFFTQMDGVTQKGRVTNIGAPLNSSKDDFGIVTDGIRKTGYFSSNRKRGGNDDDIYKFDRECELKDGCELLVAIFDAETKMPLDNTAFSFTDKDGNVIELLSNAEGVVALDNIEVGHEYKFKSVREGYITSNVTYSTDECENEPARLEIPLERPKPVVQEVSTSADSVLAANDPNSASNYKDGDGNSNDPNNKLKGKTCIIKGKVSAQSTKEGLEGVIVTLRNGCDGSMLTANSDKNGNFQFSAVEGCEYTIEGTKDKMVSRAKTLKKLKCNSAESLNSNIFMFVKGDVGEIENIYFDYGKCNLRSDAKAELDKLVKMMRQYPKLKIELSAHTDSRSEADFNQKISEGRAKASADYLFKRGISRARVEYKGYGESMLVNKCADNVECSEQEHAQNRRTEIKILQID